MKWLHGFRRRLLLKLVAAMVAICLPGLSLFPLSILPAVHEMLRTYREQAQAAAATAVKRLRSGEDKVCFWIDPSTRSD